MPLSLGIHLSLLNEIKEWNRHWTLQQPQEDPTTLFECYLAADEDRFPNIKALLRIGCTLPVGSAGGCRAFFFLSAATKDLYKEQNGRGSSIQPRAYRHSPWIWSEHWKKLSRNSRKRVIVAFSQEAGCSTNYNQGSLYSLYLPYGNFCGMTTKTTHYFYGIALTLYSPFHSCTKSTVSFDMYSQHFILCYCLGKSLLLVFAVKIRLRPVTSQLRHSCVVHPLLKKIMDPSLLYLSLVKLLS